MLQNDLSVDGQAVSTQFFSPTGNKKKLALLFLHGWRGRPNHRAGEFLAQNGFPALTVIMRGHEGSEGDIKTVTGGDSLKDAEAAYDFLKSQIGEDCEI